METDDKSVLRLGMYHDFDAVSFGRVQRPLSLFAAADRMVDAQRPLDDVAVNMSTRDQALCLSVNREIYQRHVDGLTRVGGNDPR